jgi:hypothetical protein
MGKVLLDKLYRLRYDNRTYHFRGEDHMNRRQRLGLVVLIACQTLCAELYLTSHGDVGPVYWASAVLGVAGAVLFVRDEL